jgi:hypothetical protein
MAADPDFSQKFSALKTAAERQRGPTHSSDLRLALNDLTDLSDVDDAAIAGLIPELSSPTGAGLLAVWLGARVEHGSDPGGAGRPIAEAFLKWSRTIETSPEDGDDADEDRPQPDQATIAGMRGLGQALVPLLARWPHLRRWFDRISVRLRRTSGVADRPRPDQETIAGMQLLGQALVAHLARSQHLRRWFAEADEVYSELLRVEHLSIGAVWLLTLLRQRSGKIVVLNVRHRNGVVVRYDNIVTCFHLFTLLQAALADVMPDAQKVSKDLLDIARGNQRGTGHDAAWWHYGQAHAAEPSLAASVWGEAGPDSISNVDGQQVLLLWPPILKWRSWNAGFFLPILYACPPNIEVMEVLPSAEVEAWWVRLGLAPVAGA